MDLAGALILDEQVDLAAELARLLGFEFVDELANSWR